MTFYGNTLNRHTCSTMKPISDCTDSCPRTTSIPHLQKKCGTIFQPMCWIQICYICSKNCKRRSTIHLNMIQLFCYWNKHPDSSKFFSLVNSKIENMHDSRVCVLQNILHFFHSWEDQFSDSKLQRKHLLTCKVREDIDACRYGFIHLVEVAQKIKVPIAPGYTNLDLIENWFCQICGLRNGFNSNPTLKQIGPSINSNIITGSVVSKKGNIGGKGIKHKGVLPPKSVKQNKTVRFKPY